MLVATIAAENYERAQQMLQNATESITPLPSSRGLTAGSMVDKAFVDCVELRLDYFTKLDLAQIKQLCAEFSVPKIFTLRKKPQGGFFSGTEPERLSLIEKLIALEPEYFDIEYDVPHKFVQKIHQAYPQVQLISSYHDFNTTPENLDEILEQMQQPEIAVYKIAGKANSTLDTMRMLSFVFKHNKSKKITGICMGELGKASRILAPVINSYFNYVATGNKQTAPGQLNIADLEIYNYPKLNSDTKIYALLGDPIKYSKGHIIRNQTFVQEKKNAVYVKFKLLQTELKNFFKLVKTLPFGGFSVTMPHKEAVIPYLDKLDTAVKVIQAVNTIVIKNGKLIGYNTDSIGALNAIEQQIQVKGKNIIIVGAGGTAKAIAYEALQRGGKVTIINRTVARAEKLAAQLGCQGFGIDYFDKLTPAKCDILINATSLGMTGHEQALPIPEKLLASHQIVLDMVAAPPETLLMKSAQARGCTAINGKVPYVIQGLEQHRLWFSVSSSL